MSNMANNRMSKGKKATILANRVNTGEKNSARTNASKIELCIG